MIAEFLEGWLDGRFTEAEIQERISALGLELPEPVGVTLVHLENKDNAEIGGEWDEDLLFYAAENMANEVFQTLRPVSTCRNSAGELVLLTAGEPRAVWEARGNSSNTCCKPTCRWMSSSPGAWGIRCKACLPHTKGRPRTCVPCWRRRSLSGMQKIHRRKLCPGGILPHRGGGLYACLPAAPEPGVPPEHGHHFYGLYHAGTHPPAIELLRDDDHKMYEIAEAVGYSSQHYFSSAFKKVLGVSPMEYKKSLQKRGGPNP